MRGFLGNLPKSIWKTKKRPVGRGYGSGKGRTAGKGHKGQLGTNKNVRAGFEGGQTPVYRRLPKRGGEIGSNRRFNRVFEINSKFVNLKLKDEKVNLDNLKRAFRIPFYYKRIKIIGKEKEQFSEFSKVKNLNPKIVTKYSVKPTKDKSKYNK